MHLSKLFFRLLLSLVLISTPTFAFAKDKVLKFRLSTIQSKIPTNFVAYEPGDSVLPITLAPEKTISDTFKKLHKHKHNIAFLLFDGDALVVEEYNHKVSAATPPLHVFNNQILHGLVGASSDLRKRQRSHIG